MTRRLAAITRVFEFILVIAAVFTVYRIIEYRNRKASVAEAALEVPAEWVGVGKALTLPGVSWSHKTVVLAASVQCPGSRQSLALYQELSRAADESAWRLVVVAAETAQGTREWLSSNNVELDQFVEVADLAPFGIWATPTLMLVDTAGTVTDVVTGGLAAKHEALLWERLEGKSPSTTLNNTFVAREFTLGQFMELPTARSAQFVDPSERSAFRGARVTPQARNVPLQEFAERVDIELDRERPVVVDCRNGDLGQCRVGAVILNNLRFKQIAVIKPAGSLR